MKTNNLKHVINTTDAEGNTLIINIRLNDECKNGHQDFAITATIWEKGKPKTDRYMIAGGCCHDDILAARPDLKLFVDLHLCDYSGAPMYAIENGFYHLKETGAETAREYIRATPEEFEEIQKAEDKQHFAYLLEKLNIPARWQAEASQAIKVLEELTGNEFVNDSIKTQYNRLTPEQIQAIGEKVESGYYTPEKLEERKQQKQAAELQKQFAKIQEQRNKEVNKANTEYDIKFAVLSGGLSLDNFIYYNHTNEAVFNWNDSSYYKKVTPEQFEAFIQYLHTRQIDPTNGREFKAPIELLPPGIQFKLGKK